MASPAVRTPDGVCNPDVCAWAIEPGNKSPAKAAQTATVTIRFI